MSLTHKKLLFAKAYARNPNRREAVAAAGFAQSAWARTATRLLTDPEVLAVIEKEQNRLLKREEVKKMTRADVIGELGEMLVAASDKPGRSGWSARLKVLEVLARVLDKGDEAQPGEEVKPLSTAELEKKIAELTAELHVKEPEGSSETTTIAPRTVSDVPQPQQPSTDAPERQQNAIAEAPAPNPQPPVNNFAPNPDEKTDFCPQHGSYLATRKGRAWSFCPVCLKKWSDDEKWLSSLAPAGDGRRN